MLSATLSLAAESDRLRRVITRLPVSQKLVSRFVAGDTQQECIQTAREVRATGKQITLDLLGEGVASPEAAMATRDGYAALLNAAKGMDLGDLDVSVKPSAIGLGLKGEADDFAFSLAQDICSQADQAGSTVTLDMEGSDTVDATLELGERLRVGYPTVGNVLQSNLLRTRDDLRRLARPGVRIRLVKGAYKESGAVAFQRKSQVDAAFREDIRSLISSPAYPMIATHDSEAVMLAAQCARDAGRRSSEWECQMLYGIAENLQNLVLSEGRQIRLYLPFGSDWYKYFMRRLAERPANVAFFLRSLIRS